MNLTKHDGTQVDIDADWHSNQLFITLTRTDHYDHVVSNFKFVLDDTDLEHFISTLIEFQR